MDSPPPKKRRESTTISMVVGRWKRGQLNQYSAVYRIDGYPWRLEILKSEGSNERWLNVECLKSTEAELWECTADMKTFLTDPLKKERMKNIFAFRTFASWDEKNDESVRISLPKMKIGTLLEVEITVFAMDGNKWKLRPILDESKPFDVILVIGDEKEKIEVNKESLASQSSFFDRLFNGDFKEKNMTEISIGDVEYEEFSNIMKMIYRSDGVSLTDENVHRVLELADRFELKIVMDRVASYLLSKSTSISLIQRLLIAEEFNIPLLKHHIVDAFSLSDFEEMGESPDWDRLSKETTRFLFQRSVTNSRDLESTMKKIMKSRKV